MTCIVGLKLSNKIIVAGDRAGANGYTGKIRAVPKVFKNGRFTIGYTTSFRMGQLLEYQLSVPIQSDESDMQFMVCTFVESVRSLFKEYGFGSDDEEGDRGGVFIVAYRDNLYQIESDYQVTLLIDNYAACGTGEYFALGALCAIEQQRQLKLTDVTIALTAAAKFRGDVQEPFDIVEHAYDNTNQD